VRTLVENALRYVRRGCRLRPGGRIEIDVAVARESFEELRIQVWTDAIVPDRYAAALRSDASLVDDADITLSLVRDLIQAHSGRLDLRTSRDDLEHYKTYTEITIVLPLVPPTR
jgi:hypothetical protein